MTTDKWFDIQLITTSQYDTVVKFRTSTDGVSWTDNEALLFVGGVRIVSAGIRWQYTGPNVSIGGSYTSTNTDGEAVTSSGIQTIKPIKVGTLGKLASAVWEPYRLLDLEFSFGNSGNDAAEAVERNLRLGVAPHDVISSHMVDFVVMFESERMPITAISYTHSNYLHYVPGPTMNAGHHITSVMHSRKKPVRQGTDRERAPVGHVGHRTYIEHLKDGLKHAGELMGAGAITVAGYKQLSSAISLGAQVEEELAVAGDMMGYAAPLMLTM
jgi:hypothetical protein